MFEDTYLGLPTLEGRMNKGKFQTLQSHMSKLLIEWGDDLLAQSARGVLIKAIAQAIPTYVMGVFKLPFSVCDELTRLIRNYWWSKWQEENSLGWLAKAPPIKNARGHGLSHLQSSAPGMTSLAIISIPG
jgi:hypothetical protein